MNITVSSHTRSIGDGVREEIRDRIYFALSRFSPRIDHVAVRIDDSIGARGNSQQRCRLSLRMKRLESVSMEAVGDEVAIAVARATDRTAKQVQRLLDRLGDERRQA